MNHGCAKHEPGDWRPPLVAVVGMGMGRGEVPPGARGWIERAQVIAGGRQHLADLVDHPAEKIRLATPMDQTIERIEAVSRERRTAVLASGDPLFFGIGRRLAERLGKERVCAFPNITSIQALFARLAEPWDDVRVLSLHGREGTGWLRELRRHPRVALLTDPTHTPAWIAARLFEAGLGNHKLVVGEDLGLTSENIRVLDLEQAAAQDFSPLNVVALMRQESAEDQEAQGSYPLLGIADDDFEHQAGLITKLEIRAVVLARLQLKPDLVLWDVGAGSGSVAIEAARLAPLREVVAVEHDSLRCEHIRTNLKRLQCPEIRVVCGSAPEALRHAPDPDRVFVGGGGPAIPEILEMMVGRLRPGGVVVQTAVALDTLEAVRAFWRGRAYRVDITQVQVSRSVPIGESLRFEALNPVFVVCARENER